MKIAMFTNTYLPHIGGVARSVKTLETAYRKLGHEVRVIAPEFKGAEETPNVLRVPAIQNFNGSDFSVQLPVPNIIRDFMADFQPDLIHSHHPFLLGNAALREAWKMHVPIIFTHHTLYERYTHYVPLDSPVLKRVVIQLATGYCNLCDQIIAPSESVEQLLTERGVNKPIRSIPTGIDTEAFAAGNGDRFRKKMGIPPHANVIGHVGRLAKEKNLLYLAEAVDQCLKDDPNALFLIVGDGDARDEIVELLNPRQVCAAGTLTGGQLADAYAAMDWFVFASQSETQGLVLTEAMAAGNPVIALDGPGVRDIVRDGKNGHLLRHDAPAHEFAEVLSRLMRDPAESRRLADNARDTAADFSTESCARRMLDCYDEVLARHTPVMESDPTPWDRLIADIRIEWELLVEQMSAATNGIILTQTTEADLD